MILLAAVLLWTRRRREALLIALALGLLWVGLVFSLSQSSFAALLLGLGVLAALRWKAWPVLAGAGLAALVALGLVLFAPATLNLETGSVKELDRATSGRANLIGGGLRMIRDRPVYGFGSGSYAERVPRARARQLGEGRRRLAHDPADGDGRAGRIGLAAYLALVALSLALLFDGLRGVGARWPGTAMVARAGLAAAYCALAPPHPRVRGVPGGSAVVGAAGDRRRAARRPPVDRRSRRGARAGAGGHAGMTLVRPEFEPTLPALVRRKLGVRERTTILRAASPCSPSRSPRSSSCARAWTGSARSSTATRPRSRSVPQRPVPRRAAPGRRARPARGPARAPGGDHHGPAVRAAGPRGQRRPGVPADPRLRAHRATRARSCDASSCAPSIARACTTRPATRSASAPARAAATRSGAISCCCRATRPARAELLLSLRREIRGQPEAERRRGGVRGPRDRGDAVGALRHRAGLRGPRAAGAPILGTGRVREAPRSVPSLRLSPSVASRRPDCASLSAMSRHTA